MTARRQTTAIGTALLGGSLLLGGLAAPASATETPGTAPARAAAGEKSADAVRTLERRAKPKVSLRNTVVEELTGDEALATVRAVISRKVKRNVVVRWRTVGGSAVAGEDFTEKRGRAVIKKGKKRASIRVPVTGDDVVESTEQLRVKIIKVKGAGIGKRSGRVSIVDDDTASLPAPTMVVTDGFAVEGTTGQLPVLLTAPSPTGASVRWTATAGTATADDVVLGSGQLVFAPGQQVGVVPLATIQDEETEDVETFTITFSGVSGATLGSKTTATVSVIDDDGGASLPALGGLPLELPTTEGLPFTLPLTLSSVPGAPVEVLWEIIAGTADASDFPQLSGSSTFGPDQLLKTLSIPTLDDAVTEPTETATLVLSVVSGALPPAVATVPLSILDNDGGNGGGGLGGLPVLGLGDSLPTDLGGLGGLLGGNLPIPLSLDEAADSDVTGVLTTTVSTLAGDLSLPGIPFTIPQGSLTPLGGLGLPLGNLPVGADAITFTITQLTGATSGDLTRTLPIPGPAALPALSLGSLPGSLTGLLGGSLPVPLSLDQAAPQQVTGVLTASLSTLLGSVPLGSVPFTIPQGGTSPLGGLGLPLPALASLPLGVTGLTMTVTDLTGATPVGSLTRTVPLL